MSPIQGREKTEGGKRHIRPKDRNRKGGNVNHVPTPTISGRIPPDLRVREPNMKRIITGMRGSSASAALVNRGRGNRSYDQFPLQRGKERVIRWCSRQFGGEKVESKI